MKRRSILYLSLLFLCLLSFFLTTPAESADKIRIGIVGFTGKAGEVSNERALIISDLFSAELANCQSIALYERERMKQIGEEVRLNLSGLVDMKTAVEVGRIAGAQYVLMGAITELLTIGGDSQEARATLDIRLIDTSTSEIRLAMTETGTSSNSSLSLSFAGFTLAEREFGSLQAQAIADAVVRLAYDIRREIGGEASYVISVRDGDFVIDVGFGRGAREGALYMVYVDGRNLVNMQGRVIGREELPLAVLKVTDTALAHSTCVVVQAGGKASLIERGDKVALITAAKAKRLKFLSEKPRRPQSDETFSKLMGHTRPQADESSNPSQDVAATVAQPASIATDVKPAVTTTTQPAAAPAATRPVAPRTDAPVQSSSSTSNPVFNPRLGINPNQSTDSKVIQTYSIESGLANILGIQHRNAYNRYRVGRYKAAYEGFIEAAEAYEGNYLSAYWAGVTAHKLRKKNEAIKWFDVALQANPEYQPALDYKKKL